MSEDNFYYQDFELLSELSETHSLRAWRINYEKENKPATLWASKFSIDDEDLKKSVRTRLHYFKSLNSDNLLKIHAYGYDKDSRPFYITDPFDTKGILEPATIDPSSQREAERRFMQILKVISRLQKDNIYFGNLNPNSFILTRDGTIQICSYVPNIFPVDLSDIYSSKVSNCFAPELLETYSEANEKHDVYSLGMIAYWLFAAEYPYKISQENILEYSGSYKKNAKNLSLYHPWLLEFLEKTISFNIGNRFENSEEALRFIYDYRNKKLISETLPTEISEEKTKSKVKPPTIYTHGNKKIIALPDSNKFRIRKIHLTYISLLLVIGLLISLDFRRKIEDKIALIQSEKVLTFSELNNIKNLIDKNMFQSVKRSIEELVSSEDPLVVNFLSEIAEKVAVIDDNVQRASLLKKINSGFINRINKENLVNTYEVYSNYLEFSKKFIESKKALPVWYKSFVVISNLELPINERQTAWESLLNSNSKISGALFLANNYDKIKFDKVLEEFLNNNLYKLVYFNFGISFNSYVNTTNIAKGFLHPEYSKLFSEYLKNNIEKLSKDDIKTILPELAIRSDENFTILNDYSKRKGFFSNINQVFLEIIKNNLNLDRSRKKALLNFAFGKVNIEDVKTVSNWMHIDSSKVLLALLVNKELENNTKEGKLSFSDIFDLISARNYGLQPMEDYAKWIRDNYWDKRGEIAPLLCMVTYPNFFKLEDFNSILKSQKDGLLKAKFLKTALKSKVSELVLSSLEVFKEEITLGDLLVLLKHPSTEVRIKVISKISTNDLTALKIVKDSYKKEKNLDVIKAYKKYNLI